METNEYILKLSGDVSISEPLENGMDYLVSVSGSVISQTEKSNEDGTKDIIFKLRPLLADILKEQGKTIKSIDRKKNSKKLRACIWHYYEELGGSATGFNDFEDFYDAFMGKLLANFDGIVEYLKTIK